MALVIGVIFFYKSIPAFGVSTLGIGNPTVEESQVTFPIVLSGAPPEGVSAMDFRFNYDPEVLQPVSVEAGASALKAGKRIMANVTQPGEYIVVMLGLSSGSEQTGCTDGEIARIIMRAKSTDTVPWGLRFGKATISASDGIEMPVRTMPYQGRNAGTRSPIVTPTVPKNTTSETEVDSATPASGTKPTEISNLPGQSPVLPENAETKVRASLAETRRIREGISKPNAVSAGQITNEQPEATQIAAEKLDNATEASSAPAQESVNQAVTSVKRAEGVEKNDGVQVAPVTQKIETNRLADTEGQPSVSLKTQPRQPNESFVGLWLVAGIGVLAILGLLVLVLSRK